MSTCCVSVSILPNIGLILPVACMKLRSRLVTFGLEKRYEISCDCQFSAISCVVKEEMMNGFVCVFITVGAFGRDQMMSAMQMFV